MKLITVICKPFKIDDIKDAVNDMGISGMTVSEVKGYSARKDEKEVYRNANYIVDFLPRAKIEVLVNDDKVEQTVEHIIAKTKTGKVGDGKIYITNVEKVIRIRTHETNEEAL